MCVYMRATESKKKTNRERERDRETEGHRTIREKGYKKEVH